LSFLAENHAGSSFVGEYAVILEVLLLKVLDRIKRHVLADKSWLGKIATLQSDY